MVDPGVIERVERMAAEHAVGMLKAVCDAIEARNPRPDGSRPGLDAGAITAASGEMTAAAIDMEAARGGLGDDDREQLRRAVLGGVERANRAVREQIALDPAAFPVLIRFSGEPPGPTMLGASSN